MSSPNKFFQWLWYAGPLFIWMGIILYSSSMPYENQDIRPWLDQLPLGELEGLLSGLSFTYSSSEVSLETKGLNGFIEFFIRKGAHVVVFAGLAFFCFRLMWLWLRRRWAAVVIAIFFAVSFAMLDEFRHSLNPNRTGLAQDVVLDTFGACLGIAVALMVYRRKRERNKNLK